MLPFTGWLNLLLGTVLICRLSELLVCFREWGGLEAVPCVTVLPHELLCCCPRGASLHTKKGLWKAAQLSRMKAFL